jgi:hypothetical protein
MTSLGNGASVFMLWKRLGNEWHPCGATLKLVLLGDYSVSTTGLQIARFGAKMCWVNEKRIGRMVGVARNTPSL